MSSKSLTLRSGLPREHPVSAARQGRETRKEEEVEAEEVEVEAEVERSSWSSSSLVLEIGFVVLLEREKR